MPSRSKSSPTRAQRNIKWIEEHCRVPEGRDVGKQVVLRPWQRDILVGIYDTPTRRAIISFGRKNGKGLALDTPIPTPSGWRTMGDLQAGDLVYGSDGHPTRVTAVSDVHTNLRCWRLTFSDGSAIIADEQHQWLTTHSYRPWANPRRNGSGNGGQRTEAVVTTPQIAMSVQRQRPDGVCEYNHKLTGAPALHSDDVDLPLDPYCFGLWLGDGTAQKPVVSIGDADLDHYREAFETAGYPIRLRRDRTAWSVNAAGTRGHQSCFSAELGRLGVMGDKHIPTIFLEAGTDQRWALLQGLMDSDGHAATTGSACEFTSCNPRLAYDAWRLIRSLGIKARIREADATLNGRVVSRKYRIVFHGGGHPVFRLERKQSRLSGRSGTRCNTLSIISCEEVASVPTRCIAVEAPDRLYLAGHGCIPTHNTALSAMLLLLHLVGPEARPNSQLYSAAQSREQAGILFALASKMVRMSPTLSTYVQVRETAKQLLCPEIGSVYRALSADASTAYGLSPVFNVFDELGQVKGPRSELFEALTTASAAHESPLDIVISTQAATDADLLSVLIDDAKTGADPQVKLFMYSAPDDLDTFSEEALKAANPGYGDLQSAAELRRLAEEAKRMPSREAEFANLILNQRVEAVSPLISRSVWEANGAEVVDSFRGHRVYAGLDLSETADLTALVLIAKIDGKWHVKPTFWLPNEGLVEKSRQDRVPYDIWHRDGDLATTPGKAIEYEFVAAHMRQLFDELDIRAVAFDRFNMRHLKPWLSKAGFSDETLERFHDFGQGFVSMSPAIRELEAALLSERMCHGMHPVLTMCAANAVAEPDPAGNRKLNKKKSRGRIDGLVALAMAISIATTAELEAPKRVSIWENEEYLAVLR